MSKPSLQIHMLMHALHTQMQVPVSMCSFGIVNLAFFLIFWGFFRRLSSAVSLLAELLHLLLPFHLPISLRPPCMPATDTVAACWDQAHELPRAAILLVHPDSVACFLQVHQPKKSPCVHWCSRVQDQMRGSCQESHRSRMHMEIKQDMTNTYSWLRWVHKKHLPLRTPQLIQTVLRGTAKGIFHVLSHPQGLFFREQKCFLLSWKPPPAHLQLLNQPYSNSAELRIGKSY